MAATAFFVILAAIVTFFLIRLTHARNEAVAQAARSERIKTFMEHLFDSEGQGGPSVALRAIDVLDKGVEEANRLDAEPQVKDELFQVLGQLYTRLGKLDRAYSLLSSASAIEKRIYGNESKQVAGTLVELGSARTEQGRYAEGLELIRSGIKMNAKFPPVDPFDLGRAHVELGRTLVRLVKYQEAITNFTSAVQLLSKPQAPPSDLALALDGLGSAYFAIGEYPLAETNYKKALAIVRRIYKPSNPMISEELVNLGSIQFSLQHYAAAEKYYRSGMEGTEAWYGGPNHIYVATESLLLGQALLKLDRIPEAEIYLKQALAIQKLTGNTNGDALQALNGLATAEQRAGHLFEAEKYLNRLLSLEATLNDGKNVGMAGGLSNLADVKRAEKEFVRAEALSRQALAIVEQILPPDHIYRGVILLGLGRTLVKEKRFSEAETYLSKSYSILQKQGNPNLDYLQKARAAIVQNDLALGKVAEAQKLRAEAGTSVKQ